MPFDNYYTNGNFRFINKPIPNEILPVSLPSNVIQIVKSNFVQSDVVGVTYKIVDGTNSPIAHFNISTTVGWVLQGSQINLTSADHITYYLLFVSDAEAVIGDKRLWKIMEGGDIINPGDENL